MPESLPAAPVLFAGGGTGGHIFPNVAIAGRHGGPLHFLVSNRPGDTNTMNALGMPFTTSVVRPLPSVRAPWSIPRFLWAWRAAVADAARLLIEQRIAAVVATGGFVSGPAVIAAARLAIPRVLVNLDAIPGKANRRLARSCSKVFSVYPTPVLPTAEIIGLPLRDASRGPSDSSEAKRALDLDPARPLLFVTGATHGAQSVVQTMAALVGSPVHARALRPWQVLHQCGSIDPEPLKCAYARANMDARVIAFSDKIGLAWAAADLAISRAGAGSVAEAWANATPTIFLPNPYHADQHQRFNAQPLVDARGAILMEDKVDPGHNVASIGPTLLDLLADPNRRAAMRDALCRSRPPDGAAVVAQWLADTLSTQLSA